MPFYRGTHYALRGGAGIAYLLRDEFHTDRAAGSVNGTAAEPGPGTRTVVDTDGDALSISGGILNFVNPNNVWGDPGIWYGAITRTAGRALLVTMTLAQTNAQHHFGFDNDQSGNLSIDAILFHSDGYIHCRANGFNSGPNLVTYSSATAYSVAKVLKSIGYYCLIKGGAFANWTLLWVADAGNTVILYPAISNRTALLTADSIRVPDVLWLPTPVAYDSFTRANGALGTSEATGPDGQAVTGRVWNFDAGIWTVDTNEAKGSPALGAELLDNPGFEGVYEDESGVGIGTIMLAPNWNNYQCETDGTDVLDEDTVTVHGGSKSQYVNTDASSEGIVSDNVNLVLGTWYLVSTYVYVVAGNAKLSRSVPSRLDVSDISSGTGAWEFLVAAGRCVAGGTWAIRMWAAITAGEFYVDDASVKPLTLSELFASVDDAATSDVLISADATLTTGTQAGIVMNLDDGATPANFVIAYHDGTNAILEKCVAGVYTTVITAITAYAAGATLVVIKDGNDYSLFYNNEKIGSTSTISDAGIVSNTKHGLFSTFADNRLNDFTVFPRGGGAYSELDDY